MSSIDVHKLDLAFILDTTLSMRKYIDEAKNNITKISEEIIKSEKCSLKIGLVNYRDHPPKADSYVTQVNQFSNDILEVKDILAKTTTGSGGDFPEAVCCGLHDCLEKLYWRSDAVKIAILITDAPPHGLNSKKDSMPDGCSLNDPIEIAHKMAEKGITLYCAGCEPSLTRHRNFFVGLCLITGGQYVSLKNSENLTSVIIGGTREEMSMEKMIAKVHNDILIEASKKCKKVDEEELTRRIHEVINSKNHVINKIKSGAEITELVKDISKMKNLKDVREYLKINDPVYTNGSTVLATPVPITVIKPNVTGKVSKRMKKRRTIKVYFLRNNRGLRRSERVQKLIRLKQLNITEAKKSEKTRKKRTVVDYTEAISSVKRVKFDMRRTEINVEENKSDLDIACRVAKKIIARNKLSV